MAHQLHTIKSQDDCSEFLGWLSEHTEVTSVQSYGLDRTDEGRVTAFTYGSNYTDRYYAVCNWVYSQRRLFNDWIKSYLGGRFSL